MLRKSPVRASLVVADRSLGRRVFLGDEPTTDLYGSVDKLDAFVGMVSERHVPGSEFGPLQRAIWTKQFAALRDGDRFFYERDRVLRAIQKRYGITYKHTLAELITANTDVDPDVARERVLRRPRRSDQRAGQRTCTWSSCPTSTITTPFGPFSFVFGPTKTSSAPASTKRSTRSCASLRSTCLTLRGGRSRRSRAASTGRRRGRSGATRARARRSCGRTHRRCGREMSPTPMRAAVGCAAWYPSSTRCVRCSVSCVAQRRQPRDGDCRSAESNVQCDSLDAGSCTPLRRRPPLGAPTGFDLGNLGPSILERLERARALDVGRREHLGRRRRTGEARRSERHGLERSVRTAVGTRRRRQLLDGHEQADAEHGDADERRYGGGSPSRHVRLSKQKAH